MNAPDQWSELMAAFPDLLAPLDEEMQRVADAFQHEAIAAAHSPDEPGYEVENTK